MEPQGCRMCIPRPQCSLATASTITTTTKTVTSCIMVLVYGLINTIASRGNNNFRHFEENLKPKDEDEENTQIQMKGDYRREKTFRRGARRQMSRKKISEI